MPYLYWTNKVRDQTFNAQFLRFRIDGEMKHFYHQGNSFCKLCTLEGQNNSLCIQQDQALSQTTLKMKVV